MANGFPQNVGAFVPTTNIWDPNVLFSVEIDSPQFKELFVKLYQNMNLIAINLNAKDTGIYDTSEFVNGQKYFPDPGLTSLTSAPPIPRQIFRKVINFGPLPNAGTTSVPHGIAINANTIFTRIYATASDSTGFNYVPIPYASVTAVIDNIELNVDVTNVNIITGSNRSNFNICYVVLEYLKF
jgi:hypothetical protein